MLTTVGLAQSAPQSGTKQAPKLVIDEIDHDLGVVRKSTGATHTFIFRNEGNADLEIRSVAPS